MLKTFAATTVLALALPLGAQAASVQYFDQSAFNDALASAGLASQPTVTEGFDVADVLLDGPLTGTTFGSGLSVTAINPSADNNVTDGALRISLDSSNATRPADPFTSAVQFAFPTPTRFVSLFFGEDNVGGIGNDSGTTLNNGDEFSFTNVDPGYIGFYGIIADTAFSSLTFTSNNDGTFTDDDIRIDDVTFADVAPIPLPAGLPLLLAGLGAFGIARSRRKA